MAAFPFELVSPERLLFTGEVESVVVPGSEGEMTVMKDHAPLMTTLKPGIVTVNETAGKSQRLFVRGGFADVAPTGLTIARIISENLRLKRNRPGRRWRDTASHPVPKRRLNAVKSGSAR